MSSRRRDRNTFIYCSQMHLLGGLWLNDPSSITNSRFYTMCEVFIQFPRPNQRWQLYSLGEDNSAQDAIPRNSEEIHPGRYVILSPSREIIPVQVINDQAINQTRPTRPGASRANQPNFRHALENRDHHVCPITGFVGGDGRPGNAGLSAAHIVPSGRHDVWLRDNMNGLHLANYVHGRFDNFAISVDVDNGYRIVVFDQDTGGIGGRVLSPSTRSGNPNHRVSDDLLRWHFRQAVLRWMREL
ncbi:hypothetical protein BJX65DRAFT_305667 [Aspergillus insuetus]